MLLPIGTTTVIIMTRSVIFIDRISNCRSVYFNINSDFWKLEIFKHFIRKIKSLC